MNIILIQACFSMLLDGQNLEKTMSIACSQGGDRAYRTYWKRGEYYEEQIEEGEGFQPLAPLLKKQIGAFIKGVVYE